MNERDLDSTEKRLTTKLRRDQQALEGHQTRHGREWCDASR